MKILPRKQFCKKQAFGTSSMIHAQESRMSSSQGSFKLSEESRSSGVSALVSRLNSSNPGLDNAENEKSRGDSNKTKEQKMQDTFPWIHGFSSLCQATVGCRNVKALENLMNKYLENVTPSVKDCYTKTNRASKLKKNMKDVLIFFHLFYQEVKEALERSSYLDLMTPLVSMFIDMEIKASERFKESLKKVAARLTSSLYLFLDNSEEHMLDAILMTKFVNKSHREICNPLLWKLLSNISNRKDDMFYLRYLLTFKLWKKVVPDPEERHRINKIAVQKLQAPPNLLENVKALGNVLPRIPKTKKNITLFLMQSNFNLKDACQEFLKSVKKTQKTVYSQSLGSVELDKPLFFMSDPGRDSHLLNEKDVEVDSSHNSVDLWSSISVDSIASPSNIVKELSSDQTKIVEMIIEPKKGRKLGKKGKKKLKAKASSGTKTKKKKRLKNSELAGSEKGNKKASKLKAKKKKKKKLCLLDELSSVKQIIPQGCESSQLKGKQISSQVDEINQLVTKSSSPIVKEEPEQANVKPSVTMSEQGSQVNVKVDLAQPEASRSAMVAQAVPQILDSKFEKTVEKLMKCDQEDSSKIENYELVMKVLLMAEDQIKMEEGRKRKESKRKCLDAPKTVKDKSDNQFENSKSDLFTDKPNKEIEIPVEHPKTEKIDSSSVSSSKQSLETSKVGEVDEILVKKEKDVVSTVCVASQCDLNQSVSSELKEQVVARQISSISMEKKVIKVAECKPNKLTEESVLPEEDLATKSDSKDQAECAFDDQSNIKNLFIVEKTKDKSSEGKNHHDLPKTEKLEIPLSDSNHQSSSIPDVDEPLVKKEKVDVVSNIFVGSIDSQFDIKDTMSTETREQVTANQVSCITFDKKVNEALEYAKHSVLTGQSVITSDDLISKNDNKDKSDIVFDNSRPNLFVVEKSKDELNKDAENLEVPISLVVEEKGVNGYEKNKIVGNSVPVSVYSVDMEICNFSMKEVCDNNVAIETSVVTEVSPANTDSEVEILDERQETGKCAASTSEEEIVLSDDGDLLARQQGSIFNTGNSHVVMDMIDGQSGSLPQNDISVDPVIQDNTRFYALADSFDSKTKDDPYFCSPFEDPWIELDRPIEYERPIFEFIPVDEEEDEGSPKSFESSTPKRGMGKMSFSDVMSDSRQKESHCSPYDWNGSPVLRTNYSESGTSGASSPRSESGTDSGEVGQDTMEDCDRLKTVGLCVSSDRISDDCNLRYYNSSTYDKSPETISCSKESFISQNSYVSKVGDSHLGCAPLVMENVGDSSVNKLPSRDISRLEVSSSVPTSYCESVATNVEVTSSRRTKLHHDERMVSQMASSKQVTGELSVVQAGVQALNIPIIPCPSSTPGDAITHETPQFAECSVGSRKVSAASFGMSREGQPLKKMKSSSKMHPDNTVGSQITEKQGAGEFSTGQGRPSIRGQRRRGRPPGRGRGVSSTLKISSDTKSAHKQGSSRKGKNDPEYQVTQPKKTQQYDPPITRSISKKWGISDLQMFE